MVYIVKEGIIDCNQLQNVNIIHIQDLSLAKDFLSFHQSSDIHVISENTHEYLDIMDSYPSSVTMHIANDKDCPAILQENTIIVKGIYHERKITRFTSVPEGVDVLLIGSTKTYKVQTAFLGSKRTSRITPYLTKYVHIPALRSTSIYNPHIKQYQMVRPEHVYVNMEEYAKAAQWLQETIPADTQYTLFLHVTDASPISSILDIMPNILRYTYPDLSIVLQTTLTEKDLATIDYLRDLKATIILPPEYIESNTFLQEYYSDIVHILYPIKEETLTKTVSDITLSRFRHVPYDIFIQPPVDVDTSSSQAFFDKVLPIIQELGERQLFQGPYHLIETQELLASTLILNKNCIHTIFNHPISAENQIQQELAIFAQHYQEQKALKAYEIAQVLDIPFANQYLDLFTSHNVQLASQWYLVKMILSGLLTNYKERRCS